MVAWWKEFFTPWLFSDQKKDSCLSSGQGVADYCRVSGNFNRF
jgi:hypothetical protein